jgi:hypothetical protein
LVLGVYPPLSIAAMTSVSPVGLSMAIDPLGEVAAFA